MRDSNSLILLPYLSLLQNQRQLVMVEKVDHGVLGEEPHGQQCQAGVLPGEPATHIILIISSSDRIQQLLVLRPVVVGVKGCVVEVEEPQPVSPRHVRVATDRVILKQIYFI